MEYLNSYMRPELIEMLSWYVGIKTDFSLSTGKCGKYLVNYLPDKTWQRLLKTFPLATVQSIWDSVFVMCALFEDTALTIRDAFGYHWNGKEAQQCLAYMKHIQQLPKDAMGIY
jgi:aminoglycoside 6-adenylyltransferase